MSRNGWEDGSVVVPSSDIHRLRKVLELADKQHQDRVYELTQECWRGIPRREQDRPREYRAAVEIFLEERTAANRRTIRGPVRSATEVVDAWEELALSEARKLLDSPSNYIKPARVQKGDMAFANSRTTEFVGHEATITFDTKPRIVNWAIRSRHMSLDDSIEHPLMQLFFRELDVIRWTPGTGGYVGGLGCSVRAYGPLGAEAYPDVCLPFTLSTGVKVTRADLDRKRVIQKRLAA